MKRMLLALIIGFTLLNTPLYALSIYGHRGARGLQPENTLPGYKMALKHGVDYVDMDVVFTKDQEVVVYHDLALNPAFTRDAQGKWVKNNILVHGLTLKELKQYDVGRLNPRLAYAHYFPHQTARDHTPIPTLKQVIHYVKKEGGNEVGFQIELKTDASTQRSIALAKAVGQIIMTEGIIERTEVQAFDWQVLKALHALYPAIHTAYLTSREDKPKPDQSLPHQIASFGGQCWDPEDVQVTPALLKEAHQSGLKVVAWSWTEKSGKEFDATIIKRLIQMGVDGIITDRPDQLRSFISTRQKFQ